jgi:hypothetical protein
VIERPWPWRMLVRGVFQPGWFGAPQEEKNRVFHEWIEAHQRWGERGCRFIATLDDELNLVGSAPPGRANFYSLWELPSPDVTYDLLNDFRAQEPGATRLDGYFRLETIVGKPIVGLEKGLGGPQSPTGPLREEHGR